MSDQQREIVRQNYNAIAKRISDEQFLLHPDWEFDPVQLAHHVNVVIDELKQQRDQALATLAILHGGDIRVVGASGTVALGTFGTATAKREEA